MPVVLIGFHLIGKQGRHRMAISWLVSGSLFFYGWWNPAYLGLIITSILFNYAIGIVLLKRPDKKIVAFGVIGNLGALGYFKYANFFINNVNDLVGGNLVLETIILPLGISFFTFQQITYLLDSYRGESKEYDFLNYCLFVVFFPQLIAGPIVHHKEMMPQFAKNFVCQIQAKNLAVGLTIFAIGLFKKVVIADGVSIYANPVFDAAEAGITLTFFEAWGGALAYNFQLYFDFSGYSDMAIGIGRMFGIRLPINFNSPYKASNIVDFWRRWHITLSRLIRDYIYYPTSLRLTRYAMTRNHNPISIFLLTILFPTAFAFFWVGLWHGAGWNFIIFGLVHGSYIVIHSLWSKVKANISGIKIIKSTSVSNAIGWSITFFAVVFSWVLFRAPTMGGANSMLIAMVGGNGLSLPDELVGRIGNLEQWLGAGGVMFDGMFHNMIIADAKILVAWLLILLMMSVALPNTQQIMIRTHPALETYKGEISELQYQWMKWQPAIPWALFTSGALFFAVAKLTHVEEFLYFQF